MNEKLLEKLKKLLNLSKSSNINEAELALQKATAMAAEAGIDLAIVSSKADSETEKLEMVKETAFNGKRLPSLQKYASWLLKKYFNVHVVYSGGRYYGRSVNLLGDKKDVEFAKFVNEFVQEDMQRRWEYYKKSNGVSVSMKETFMYNLWRGLDSKLAEAKATAEQNKFNTIPQDTVADTKVRYGLVVSNKAAAVQQFVNKTYSRLSKVRKVNICNFSNSGVATAGYLVGRSMSINRPISC
jgi:hypothetical protein